MPGQTLLRILLMVAVYMTSLTLLRYKPWQNSGKTRAKDNLQVGFLPVT